MAPIDWICNNRSALLVSAARYHSLIDAQDLVQSTAVKVLRKQHEYRDRGYGPGPWVRWVMRSIVIDLLRVRSRRDKYQPIVDHWYSDLESTIEHRLPPISDLLDGLPAIQRKVMVAASEGRTNSEIGILLRKTANCVAGYKHKAILALREQLL